ncbi:hypothetical protein BA1DRAFT_00544, partial [Photorhabdus aegyptia]
KARREGYEAAKNRNIEFDHYLCDVTHIHVDNDIYWPLQI